MKTHLAKVVWKEGVSKETHVILGIVQIYNNEDLKNSDGREN